MATTSNKQINITINAIDRTEMALRRIESNFSSLSRSFSFLSNVAPLAFSVIAASLTRIGVGFDIMRERQEYAFSGLLKNRDQAIGFLDELYKWVNTTALGYEQAGKSATEFLARGFSISEVIPTLKAVGDAAAALDRKSVV